MQQRFRNFGLKDHALDLCGKGVQQLDLYLGIGLTASHRHMKGMICATFNGNYRETHAFSRRPCSTRFAGMTATAPIAPASRYRVHASRAWGGA